MVKCNFFDKFIGVCEKYKNIILYFIFVVLMFLFVNYNDGKLDINYESKEIINYVVFTIPFGVRWAIIKSIRKIIVFDTNKLTIKNKLLFIRIGKKEYNYDLIYKFIFGKFYINMKKCYYGIYIDYNNSIKKIINITTYNEYFEIKENIKNKTKKKIYDDTDEITLTEDDLFRKYYKTEEFIKEIKEEKTVI